MSQFVKCCSKRLMHEVIALRKAVYVFRDLRLNSVFPSMVCHQWTSFETVDSCYNLIFGGVGENNCFYTSIWYINRYISI